MMQRLSERLASGPLEIPEFLEAAIALAEGLARFHAEQFPHGALSTGSIGWDPGEPRATLGPAAEALPQADFDGDLTYLAPEQTGRTAHAPDRRSDLYALGAIYYELLTGRPPLAGRDRLEKIHALLAVQPVAPDAARREVPPVLSAIVLKLLAKTPEKRYASADALAADLREARERWRADGHIDSFPLAPGGELQIPERLYGRAGELASLPRLATQLQSGERVFLLVTGEPGIGKTALAGELVPLVAQAGGFFAFGKFDQLGRNTPYSALVQALRALVRRLLAEPESKLAGWRERIGQALAPNGQLLVEVIPELELLVGPQPPVPALGALEAKNRFRLVFQDFIRVFARKEHPLAIFLDDLQWVDASSLDLLQQLVAAPDIGALAIVGAYREGEVHAAHPLALALAAMREAQAPIREIHLGPLETGEVAALLRDALGLGQREVLGLAELLVRKTGGNPFFLRQLLRSLQADGWLRRDTARRRWVFDLAEIERAAVTPNVVDLMVRAIDRMPEATRELLKMLSCIGNRADLATLATVTDRSLETVRTGLAPALESGLLLAAEDSAAPAVQFVHDRVQQAAYSLVLDRDKPALHLGIGRLMLRRGPPEEAIFDVVEQLDRGMALIVDREERLRAAELNLQAGRRAKASAAYEAAFAYLGSALELLGADPWNERADLAFEAHAERAEAAYLTARHDVAESLIDQALLHAPSSLASAQLYALRVVAATVAGDYARALEWGNKGLELFGLGWPAEGLAEAAEAETARVMETLRAQLDGRPIETLAQAPETQDPEIRAAIRLLSMLGPPAYFHDPARLVFILARITNLSLAHGPSPYSAYGYTFYGALHNRRTGDYDTGHEFGKLALALARRFGDRGEQSRTFQVFGLIVNTWKAPLRSNVPLFREGYRAGLEAGQLQYAAYNLVALLINALPLGTPLAAFEADVDASLAFSTRHKDKTMVEFSLAYRQALRCLAGRTRAPGSFEDDEFDEAAFAEDARDNRTAVAFYWVLRQQVAVLLGDAATARHCGRVADGMIGAAMGMIVEADHVLYSALAAAADARPTGGERDAALARLDAARERLAKWSSHCAENFLHKLRLVEAERARLRGAVDEASRLYDEAIAKARREGIVHEEALGAELAARFHLEAAEAHAALRYLREARDAYRRWGATAKVRALEQAHPELAARGPDLPLDALALIKASQAIAAETVPQRLLERILSVMTEVSGAESGALAQLDAEGRIAIRARTGPPGRELPETLVRYALRVREPLVLADAAAEGPLAGDAEVRALGVRSLLCVPLPVQAGTLVCLENRELRGAFPTERVELVRALAHQAAISLDNSRLLGALRESERRLNVALEASQLGQWDLDLRRHVASRTPQHDRIFGYDPMLPDWTYERFLEHVVPEDRHAVDARFKAAVADGAPWDFECRIRRADGERRWIWARGQVERDAGGAPSRMLGTVQDVTERKRTEEALKEADRRKDEFLATLSHELRNPLAPLTNSLHLLRMTGDRGMDPKPVHAMMARQLGHLVRLVDDLLEMTRITRGTFALRREPLDLASVVHSAVEAAEPLVRDAGHHLDLSLPPEPLTVDGDPVRLAQVLANLLNNAARYTERGGRIALELRRENGHAAVCVRDNGQGISPEDLPRIFEMFSRGGGSNSRVQGGLGIGLSLARRLAEMHGGTIEAASAGIGQGAEFTVRLPLAAAPAPAPAPKPLREESGLAPRRILVVDDNRDGAESLGMVLEAMGAEVHVANDGPAALTTFDACRPDVVLLDIGMPGMDGYEVARRLRGRENGARASLIALTGWGQEQDKAAAREAGFDHHLTKPPDLDALRSLLASPPPASSGSAPPGRGGSDELERKQDVEGIVKAVRGV